MIRLTDMVRLCRHYVEGPITSRRTHATLLQEQFERLVAFPPTTFPVISLYLNAEPDQHGKDDQEKVIEDVLRLDISAPEHEVLKATLDAMVSEDRREDADRVRRAIEGHRGGGLAP